jgi:hypothetical protein
MKKLVAIAMMLAVAACTNPVSVFEDDHTTDSGSHTTDSGSHTTDSGSHTTDSGS